ncbi:hypothetical protein IB276_32845 [Ensifer sp. ENS04]|uniref:hypothetical protein n=1 Tax=Ensifer sp. ENS04 TaxID=2769281 RepID=UPI001783A9AF|nr:hypothetical protein [Ensifer sp. ENS04]MBD9544234.1 hypothetical protein [Ensifer sp. ENS04]
MAKKEKKLKSKGVKEVILPNAEGPIKGQILKTVLIATPCYNGQVSHTYMSSVVEAILLGPSRGYKVELYTLTDSLITRARNNAVATFLAGDWDYLFWVDADIAFTTDQFFRLLDSDLDVTSAAYPLKRFFWPDEGSNLAGRELELSMMRYAITLPPGDTKIPADGFIPVTDAATGFMCIKRWVLLHMIENYPDLKYTSDQVQMGAPDTEQHYLFFDTLVEDGRYLSEDYAFCRRAQRVGVKIWTDIRSELVHSGNYDFRGSVLKTSQINTR